mgnify:FL=1|jgi:hypothetical protein
MMPAQSSQSMCDNKHRKNQQAAAGHQVAAGHQADAGPVQKRQLRALRVPCPCCGNLYANLAQHNRWSERCRARSLALEASDNEDTPAHESDAALDALLDDAAACDIADGLASLKYERSFKRPDVVAAKDFAGIVGKRTREIAFESLQGLLRPDITRSEFDECMQAAEAKSFNGIATEAQEMAYLKRTLPMLDVRTADLGEDHRVVTVSAIDATIRLIQEHPAVCKAMIAKSEEWKKGDKWKQTETDTIDHMDKGSAMRFHPHAMRPAGPDEVCVAFTPWPILAVSDCVSALSSHCQFARRCRWTTCGQLACCTPTKWRRLIRATPSPSTNCSPSSCRTPTCPSTCASTTTSSSCSASRATQQSSAGGKPACSPALTSRASALPRGPSSVTISLKRRRADGSQ